VSRRAYDALVGIMAPLVLLAAQLSLVAAKALGARLSR